MSPGGSAASRAHRARRSAPAADFIFETLRGAGVTDLGRLFGVSTKTVNAWKAGGPVTRNARRVVVLAQVLTYLRASMTPAGLVMWFDAPRHQLDGGTPLELLDDDEANARELLLAACPRRPWPAGELNRLV